MTKFKKISKIKGDKKLSHKGIKVKRLSSPQKIFELTVHEYILKQAREMAKILGTTVREEKRAFELALGMFKFYNGETVSIDADLWEVLNNGHADFGAFRDLGIAIRENLEKNGFYMENVNGCDWVFARN